MPDSTPRGPGTVPSERARAERGPGITLETAERLAWLTLDDGRANAIGSAFCEAMEAHLDAIEASDAHTVVLRGRPGFFSGGLDLKELPGLEPDALSAMTGRFMAMMRRLFLFPKPIVAAADGHAIAGGMMLYLCADVRLAVDRDDALFGLNEAVTGIPLLGGTAGICQAGIPAAHQTELILHGRLITPRGTLERGITHEVVPDSKALEVRAGARAAALRDVDLPAYALNKRILRQPAWDGAVAQAAQLAGGLPGANPFTRIRR